VTNSCRIALVGVGLLAIAACDQGAAPVTATTPAAKSDAAVARPDVAVQVVDASIAVTADASVAPPAPTHYVELPENDSGTPNCIKVVVGSAREKGTLCDEFHESLWRVTHQYVRVVRAGKSVRVLDVPTKIEGFDNGILMLQQRLRIATDGMSAGTVDVTSTDRPTMGPAMPGRRYPRHGLVDSCDHRPDPKDDERVYGAPSYNEARRPFCEGRGSYRWSGDRFELVR
jgi:hypothetical protein